MMYERKPAMTPRDVMEYLNYKKKMEKLMRNADMADMYDGRPCAKDDLDYLVKDKKKDMRASMLLKRIADNAGFKDLDEMKEAFGDVGAGPELADGLPSEDGCPCCHSNREAEDDVSESLNKGFKRIPFEINVLDAGEYKRSKRKAHKILSRIARDNGLKLKELKDMLVTAHLFDVLEELNERGLTL